MPTKISIMFNQMYINEEMLPKVIYIYIYIFHPTSLNKQNKLSWKLNTIYKFHYFKTNLSMYLSIYVSILAEVLVNVG